MKSSLHMGVCESSLCGLCRPAFVINSSFKNKVVKVMCMKNVYMSVSSGCGSMFVSSRSILNAQALSYYLVLNGLKTSSISQKHYL